MSSPKFDETDRDKVISEIERHFKVSLSRVGRRRKYLSDKNGRSFWVVGGYENWHGIPPDMLREEQRRATNGVLVVAKRYDSKIDIFAGDLQKLIDNENKLSHTKNGDFQFNIDIRLNRIIIKEIPDLVLLKIGTPSYERIERKEDRKAREMEEYIRSLTPEQKNQFLIKLGIKQDT